MIPQPLQEHLFGLLEEWKTYEAKANKDNSCWEILFPKFDEVLAQARFVMENYAPDAGIATQFVELAWEITNEGEDMVYTAKQMGSPAIEWLRALSRSTSVEARWQVAEACRYFGNDGWILLRGLAKDQNSYVRRRAVISIFEAGAPDGTSFVTAMLLDEEEYNRYVARKILGENGQGMPNG